MQHTLTSNKGFYIGDICYVLSDEVYHDIWGSQHAYQEGKIQVGDNAFAVDRTAYGDGLYSDNNGREYPVDAGVIGCVPFELVDMDKLYESHDPGADPIDILDNLGLFVEGSQAEFETDDEGEFTVTVDNQIAIVIDTNHEAGYEEDDEDSGEHYELDEYYDDSDDEEYFEEYDEESAEEFVEYNGLEPGDEYIEEVQYPESNVERVLVQARDNPAMFRIHTQGEVTSDGVTVKFIYYANPRKPLDGTYIDIDSSDPNFEKVFKGHLNRYLPQDEICEIILKQLADYLQGDDRQQSAKEQISDGVLSKLNGFDADQGNYPLEGAAIYYDSQYLRFNFTGIDENSAKNKVLSFLFSQGFNVNKSQLYTTKYGSSVVIFLHTSSLPEPSSGPLRDPRGGDSGTIIYPDDFPVSEAEIDVVRTIIVKNLTKPITEDYFSIFPNLKTAKILGSVETVYGFANCKKLTKVIIEEGVAGIGKNAFKGDERLTTITIPNSLASIGEYAFYCCILLRSIALPDSMTNIEPYTFYGCNSLTDIEIPNSITSIGEYAFYYCRSLRSVVIPDGVTSIEERVFTHCSNLTSVTMGNNITSIGFQAFCGCNILTNIELPNSLTSIGYAAFEYCESLNSITIPNNVTEIGARAFERCKSLTSIEIPNSVTSIGDAAFIFCEKLTKVNYLGTIDEWVKIEFEDYSSNPLSQAKKLYINGTLQTEITISVEKINASAFESCRSLTSVTIDDNVTSIGDRAFYGCRNLTDVVLGSGIASIGDQAFLSCSKLQDIRFQGTAKDWENLHLSLGIERSIQIHCTDGTINT